MEVLIMIAQMILGLSILVGVHELGHLVAAKVFGMRVEKFSIGFPPKLLGVRFGETEYTIGALPLGGFVKISGMIDESLDTTQMKTAPQPWEFRSKPAWQRLIVMLGGILVNVATGILIFILMVYSLGEQYYSTKEVNRFGIYVGEIGSMMGLKDGDKIIKINGQTFDNFNETRNPSLLLSSGAYYIVERDGQEVRVDIPSDIINRLSDKKMASEGFFYILEPFKVGKVVEGSPAHQSGLLEGDRILEVSGEKTTYFHQLRRTLSKKKGEKITLLVERNDTQLSLEAQVSPEGTIGFYPQSELQSSTLRYSFGQAAVKGTKQAFSILTTQVMAVSKMISGEVSAGTISGPIGIAQVFGGVWNWINFWSIVGALSIVIAFMNLLPIPALDGGHVVFLIYEMLVGKAPSEKILEIAQRIGMAMLLALMIFAFGNDIYKLIFSW